MKKYPTLFLLLLLVGFARAQSRDTTNQIYVAVEESARFPGGIKAFSNYLAQNIKYPDDAIKSNIQGRVFLTFIIEKDGSLSTFKVVRGVSPTIDAEALRVLQASPKWVPGKQGGKAVREQYTVPLNFTLPPPKNQ